MWNRGGARSSVLERAKAQLSGQKPSNISKNKRDEGIFGTVAPQTRQTRFLDLNTVPSSLNHDDPVKETLENFSMGGGSRFLKKTSGDATRDGGTTGTETLKEFIPQRSLQSAALSRLLFIENRFKYQKGEEPGVQAEDTDRSLRSSSDLSLNGSHFPKKKSEPSGQMFPQKTTLDAFVPCVNERKGRTFSPDSDEQDMQRLLGDSFSLSEDIVGKPASPKPVNKSYRKNGKTSSVPSPTSDGQNRQNQGLESRVKASSKPPSSSRVMFTESLVSSKSDHSEIRSLDDLFPVGAASDLDDTVSECAASDDFKLHVMTLDDLAPVLSEMTEISPDKNEIKSKTEVNSKTSSKDISAPASEEISAAYESDFESEILSVKPQSVSEISEHLSDDDRDVSVVSEAQYSSFKSQDDEGTVSESSRSSRRNRASYSESSSQSSSNETLTRGLSPDRKMKEAAVQTQTDGLTYTWSSGTAAVGPSLGMTYVDPTPIACHTVSAEALESVTSYSPAMLVLNDMLRQQLALTRAFIESTRHHYASVLESLGPANYKYTTLEDTKEFIRTHRPPKLSVEKALQDVQQEMREYSYH